MEEAVGIDTKRIECIADRVTHVATRSQHKNSTRFCISVLDSSTDNLGDPMRFVFEGAPLEHNNLAFGILWQRPENAWRPAQIVGNQHIRQLDHLPRAAPTFFEPFIMCAGMGSVERGYALGVSKFERIDSLIFISYHDQVTCLGEQIKKDLFSFIKVLVFVDQNVIEDPTIGRGRILSQIAKRLRDKLTD
jgi:hypothetical protein